MQTPNTPPDHPTTGAQLAYSIAAAAAALDLGRTTIYAEIKAGRLATIRVGSRRIITADALAQFLADRTRDAA